MKNVDKLRALSVEKIADFLVDCDCFQAKCPCDPRICVNEGCRASWVDWLEREAEDG